MSQVLSLQEMVEVLNRIQSLGLSANVLVPDDFVTVADDMEVITDVLGRYVVGHANGSDLKEGAQYVVLNIGVDDNGCASDTAALEAAYEYALSVQSRDPQRAFAIETALVNQFGENYALDWGEDETSDEGITIDLDGAEFESAESFREFVFEPTYFEPVETA